MYDFLVAGTGIFGAVFAYEAQKRGKTCLVIDSRGTIGGNLYCENIRGIQVHCYGPHILQTDDRKVWEYLNSFEKFIPCVKYKSDKRYTGVPEHGYTALIGKLLKNCNVYLNTDYSKFRREYPDIAKRVLYTGRLDEYFDYCLGTLSYEMHQYETELLYQKHYQKHMTEEFRGKNLRIIEHKYLTEPTDSVKLPFTVITRETWSKNRKEGIPLTLNQDRQNILLFQKYRELAGKENGVLFGGRLFHSEFYGIDDAVKDAWKL